MNEFEESLSQLPADAAEAAAALEGLKGPAEEAGRAISAAFERAGASLTRSLARAASDGKISLDELAAAALAVVNALAKAGSSGARSGGGDLGSALAQALSGAFRGGRADGGPVVPGGGYLVGERGPEVFRPASAGEVAPLAAGVTVRVSVERGAEGGLVRSEAQLAQALARAVSLGARRV